MSRLHCGKRTSAEVPDSDISSLARPEIWEYMWGMRRAGACTRSVRAVCRRWERLTGRRYYG
jgi:hypothetical protein